MFCVCFFVQVRTSLDGSRSRLREYQIVARIEDDEYDGLLSVTIRNCILSSKKFRFFCLVYLHDSPSVCFLA
jgi:hypothetical protein